MSNGETTAPTPNIHLGTFEEYSDAWVECLRAVIDHGHDVRDGSENLRELLNVTLSAASAAAQPLLAIGADGGRIALMQEKYSTLGVLPQYTMSYGQLFYDHQGIDQVQWLIRRLLANPDSKSATIGFHIPGNAELSCISLMDGKIRAGRLYTNVVYRSQNVYASQPGNVLALARIHRAIAEQLNIEAGPITLHILSAHIYAHDLDAAARMLAERAS